MGKLSIEKSLGELKVREYLFISIRETQYDDETDPHIDIRYKVDSPDKKYLTKRGFRLPMKFLPELIMKLEAVKNGTQADRKQ